MFPPSCNAVIDSDGRLRTKLYDKRNDFNFPIVNFPFIYSNNMISISDDVRVV